jgi:hypothetical protein
MVCSLNPLDSIAWFVPSKLSKAHTTGICAFHLRNSTENGFCKQIRLKSLLFFAL